MVKATENSLIRALITLKKFMGTKESDIDGSFKT